MLSLQKSRRTDKCQTAHRTDKQHFQNLWCHAAALIFALFMVFGRSFEKTDSWSLVLGSAADLLLSLVQGICWYLVFFVAIFYLYRFWDVATVSEEPACPHGGKSSRLIRAAGSLARKYMALLRRYPVRIVFSTMMIVNLPYMILSYPAIFMGDTGIRRNSPHQPSSCCAYSFSLPLSAGRRTDRQLQYRHLPVLPGSNSIFVLRDCICGRELS